MLPSPALGRLWQQLRGQQGQGPSAPSWIGHCRDRDRWHLGFNLSRPVPDSKSHQRGPQCLPLCVTHPAGAAPCWGELGAAGLGEGANPSCAALPAGSYPVSCPVKARGVWECSPQPWQRPNRSCPATNSPAVSHSGFTGSLNPCPAWGNEQGIGETPRLGRTCQGRTVGNGPKLTEGIYTPEFAMSLSWYLRHHWSPNETLEQEFLLRMPSVGIYQYFNGTRH